jgi:hypothetical protein
MKSIVFIAGLSAGLLFAAGSAAAGPCTAQIEELEKTLASTDAGMGPAGMGPTGTDAITGTGTIEQHPPTDTMSQAAEGKATSPEDVLQQNQGEPTDSDAAEAGQTSTAAGIDDASGSLQRAKELDQKGDETACMAEIARAKGALGLQ